MALKRMSDVQGGSAFFKPKEYETAVALLIEPKSIARDVPNEYMGVSKPRDEVTGDVTVFLSAADLASGRGVEVKGAVFTHAGITNRLGRAIGEAVVGKMGQEVFKPGQNPAWVVADVDDATYEKVAEFYEAREAAVAEALASTPSFD